MHQSVVTRTCGPCGREFKVKTGTFEPENRKTDAELQQKQNGLQKVQSPLRLTLNDWSVFSTETNILAPQQAEGVVCNWLQNTAAQMDLFGDAANFDTKLYGKIVFDPLGELYDFEISALSPEMLELGFENWMSTLASGEVLLDIVNELIRQISFDCGNKELLLPALREPLDTIRLLDVAPNKLAICKFLLNHNQLIDKFLDPILTSMRDMGLPPPGTKPGTAGNIRQALHLVRPVGHNLLRSRYATREWTWKALMLLVLILMALCGSLSGEQEELFGSLTGEFDTSQLVVPELQQALKAIAGSKPMVLQDQPAVEELRWALPYRRVLKQGPIEFHSVLKRDFGLE